MVFLVSTTLVAVLKRENGGGGGNRRAQEETQGVMETYKLLLSIIKLPSVFTFCLLLLTAKVGLRHRPGLTRLQDRCWRLLCSSLRWAFLQQTR